MGFTLIETMADAKQRRENEIDKICSRHYGDFLTSVQELLQIRGSADDISHKILEVHEIFDEATEKITSILKQLDTLQAESENANNVLSDVQRCKEFTTLMVQAKKCIAEEDYFSALTTIEVLKRELGSAGWKPFASTLVKWLPGLIDQLLSAAKLSMQTWLIDMQSKTILVGLTMIRRYAQSCIVDAIVDDNDIGKNISLSLLSMKKVSTSEYNALGWNIQEYIKDMQKSIPMDYFEKQSAVGSQFLDDISDALSPLHKALHMHSQLGMLPRIRDLYCEGREIVITQKLVTIEVEKLLNQSGLVGTALPDILSSICGFFVLECIIQRSVDYAEGVFSWTQLRELWGTACTLVEGLIQKFINSLSHSDQVLKLKECLLLVHETLYDDAFGLKDRSILDGTNILWSKLNDLHMQSVTDTFTAILNQESYQPLFVSSFSQYKALVINFELDSSHFNLDVVSTNSGIVNKIDKFDALANLDALEQEQEMYIRPSTGKAADIFATEDDEDVDDYDENNFVPLTLPFSGAVPKIMMHLRQLMFRYLQFIIRNSALSPRGTSLCSAVESFFKSIVNILTTELSKDGAETPLSKACQISIDAASLSYCCANFKDLVAGVLAHVGWVDAIETNLEGTILRSQKALNGLSVSSQDLMFELLSAKVTDLLSSLCFVNWTPSVLPNGPHESVEEIVDYLRVTFMWLTNLPRAVRDAAHFSCCSRTSTGLLDFILSPKVPGINILSIMALDLDVKLLDQFADSCGVGQLRECFSELRDLISAILHKDFLRFGENPPTLRKQYFPRLNVLKLAQLVDKVNTMNSYHKFI
jgi:hypothetical protein